MVTSAKPVLDEVSDHRAGPDARLIARGDRSALDEHRQRRALELRQLWLGTLRDLGPKTVDVVGVVPLQPAIHRPACDLPIAGDVGDASTIDVRSNGSPPSPLRQVVLELPLEDELVQPLELRGASARASDRVSCPGLRHDRETMIPSRSAVKRGSQATRSCLAPRETTCGASKNPGLRRLCAKPAHPINGDNTSYTPHMQPLSCTSPDQLLQRVRIMQRLAESLASSVTGYSCI